MQSHGGISPDKFQLNQIQSGRLLAILTLICLVYDKPCQLAIPVTKCKNMRFQVEIYPEKYQLDQMQNGQLEGIIDFNMHGRLC